MDFGLSDEQRLLDETVRRFLAERLPVARLRERREDAEAFDAPVWKDFAALGAVGCLVDEAHGGAGLGVLDAVVIATALGHAAAPLPFLSSAVLAPLLLGALGSPEQQGHWLPRLAAGETRVAVAAAEQVERRQDAGVQVAGGSLSGTALFVVDAPGAAAYLVPTGTELWLVPADAAGLELRPLPSIDASRRLGELRFAGVAASERVGPAGGAAPALARAIDVARVVLAADALGSCDRALALAVAYAQERRQFDRPIASFQAVKHLCAEMAAAVEPARALVWYAAHAFDAGARLPEEPGVLAALAKSHLSEVASFVLRTATEVHGGIGFTDACDLHFWFHRAALGRQLLGGPEKLRARAAALQGWASCELGTEGAPDPLAGAQRPEGERSDDPASPQAPRNPVGGGDGLRAARAVSPPEASPRVRRSDDPASPQAPRNPVGGGEGLRAARAVSPPEASPRVRRTKE